MKKKNLLARPLAALMALIMTLTDRKSTRLNSSHS